MIGEHKNSPYGGVFVPLTNRFSTMSGTDMATNRVREDNNNMGEEDATSTQLEQKPFREECVPLPKGLPRNNPYLATRPIKKLFQWESIDMFLVPMTGS